MIKKYKPKITIIGAIWNNLVTLFSSDSKISSMILFTFQVNNFFTLVKLFVALFSLRSDKIFEWTDDFITNYIFNCHKPDVSALSLYPTSSIFRVSSLGFTFLIALLSLGLYRNIRTQIATMLYAINVPIDSISTSSSKSSKAATNATIKNMTHQNSCKITKGLQYLSSHIVS